MDDTEKNTVTRAYLADIIYREIGLSFAESSELVDSLFEEIITALEAEDIVKISSFGSFQVRRKKERVGRNPKTKEEASILPRNVVSFYASNIVKKRINHLNTDEN